MERKALRKLAEKLVKADYSDCTFSDFEYYPIMASEFPEVKGLTDEEESFVMETMETLIEEGAIVEDRYIACAICGRQFERSEMAFTYDCHGIPFRLVCGRCYDKVMDEKGYDGEYYTEADECIDWDY